MNSMQKTSSFSMRPDWPAVQGRWKAFWERQATDRPCMYITAPCHTGMPKPVVPESIEARWMDPEYLANKARYYFASTYLLGDAPPAAPHLMAGTTTGCGSNINFSEGAIEILPCMRSITETTPWHPGPGDPWRPKVEKIVNLQLDLADGKFMVDYMLQYPISDLLSLLRGTSEFMLDLIDDPAACLLRLKEMFPLWLEDYLHFRSMVECRQGTCGSLSLGIWSPDRVITTQSDMSLMISREIFDRFVLAEFDMLAEHCDYLWYHACGCKRHLVSLLTRTYIRAIQYAPDGHDPDSGPSHIAFYREVQAAGRCLDISGGNRKDLEYLIRHLRPEGLLIHTSVEKPEDAEQLLDDAVHWSGANCHSSV